MLQRRPWLGPNPHLVGQLLVQFFRDCVVEFLLEVPGRNADRVDHLHQHEHGAH